VENNSLYLRHCGFFDNAVSLDQGFSYTVPDSQPPSVNVDTLPE
jgi:hypothetical protein